MKNDFLNDGIYKMVDELKSNLEEQIETARKEIEKVPNLETQKTLSSFLSRAVSGEMSQEEINFAVRKIISDAS